MPDDGDRGHGARPRVTTSVRWIFAAGGVSNGIVLMTTQYFVLIYYSQILGLSASLTGLAMAIALMVDAVSDPAVGFVSDNWRSRWGRRHPFLYAATIPITVFYILLWFPPAGLGSAALFSYLLVCIVGIRVAITLFEVPSNALVPELTTDYEERTRLFAYKESAYWMVGAFCGGILMYSVFLRATVDFPDGVLNPAGYRNATLTYAPFVVAALLISSIGLHRFIPYLSVPKVIERFGPRQFLRQTLDVMRLSSLRAMLIASVISATASGISLSLWVYLYSYFWEATSPDMSNFMIVSALGAPPGLYLLSRLGERFEKKPLSIFLTLAATFLSVLPIMLRLLGTLPANGTSLVFWILMLQNFLQGIVFVMLTGILASMVADLVEQVQLKTAHRAEGIILSTVTFSKKAAMALGTVLAGVMLDLVAFPTGTAVGDVSEAAVVRLGVVYGPILLLFSLLGAYFLSRYRIDREDHARAVAALDLNLGGTASHGADEDVSR